jgi:hypothetical protein
MHESYTRDEEVKLGSNRSFGLTIGGVFAAIAVFIFLTADRISILATVAAVVFLAAALLTPALLAPLNKLWFRFGLILHKVVSPVILGVMFFVIITPAGFLLRLFSPQKPPGWVERTEDERRQASFRNQF